MANRNRTDGSALWLILGGIILVVLLLIGIPYLNNPDITNFTGDQNSEEAQGGGPPEGNGTTNVTTILNDVTAYAGRSVTIEGEVDEILANRIFMLDQEGTISGDEILVLSRDALPPDDSDAVFDAQDVRVTGTVRVMTIVEIERELNLNLDPQIEARFEGEPVIVASDVTPLEERR